MINTGKLAGKTVFITGASRGIGKAIALKVARDGANVVIAAKTAEPHPKLPGTIYSAAKEIEAAGGQCLPCIVDVRDEGQVRSAVEEAVNKFGRIDVLVNNASAISLTGTLDTPMKKYDLMNSVNARGTYLVSQCCIPYMKGAENPHILNLSPPLNLNPIWFENHVAYTMAKYGMSMCVLGMSREFKKDNIAVNALWPRTAIITAAMEMLGGGKEIAASCRKPEIMADAAYVMITKDSKNYTGNFAIDEEVLAEVGITDLDQYAVEPGHSLLPDFFLDEVSPKKIVKHMEQFGNTPRFSPEGKENKPQSESKGEVEAVFESVKGIMNNDIVEKTKALYAFNLKGAEESQWFLDLKNGTGAVGKGVPESADVTFIMDSKDFVKMFQGKMKPTAAFMSGKLKMKGDMGKAMKLEKILNSLSAKL